MFAVYLHNRTLAKKAQSKALKAAAKDNLSDVVTSLGTSVAIGASALNYPIVDQLVAIVITFFILKTAYDIFIDPPSVSLMVLMKVSWINTRRLFWNCQRSAGSNPNGDGPTEATFT